MVRGVCSIFLVSVYIVYCIFLFMCENYTEYNFAHFGHVLLVVICPPRNRPDLPVLIAAMNHGFSHGICTVWNLCPLKYNTILSSEN